MKLRKYYENGDGINECREGKQVDNWRQSSEETTKTKTRLSGVSGNIEKDEGDAGSLHNVAELLLLLLWVVVTEQ